MIAREFGGVSLRQIAREFGTPTYVYDRAMIERRIDDLNGFPVIRYAQKACGNIALLDLMRRKGVLVDAVSAGEIARALRAGFAPKDIVYTADIFDHPALEILKAMPIGVNCGSSEMLEQLGRHCPGREATLRINPGFGHGHSQKTNTGGDQSKHGIWHEQLKDALQIAERANVRVTGIHMHIGSGSDFEHLATVRKALMDAALTVGARLTRISAGGGLPIPYRPGDRPIDINAYTSLWLDAHADIQRKLDRSIELEVEPGRYLVAEAGVLLAEIRAIKKQKDNTFYLLNAGFNNLARPIMYGAYHPLSICPADEKADPSTTLDVVVGGPLCESGDIFTQREGGFVETRNLPAARVGDYLTIHCAGAYGFAMSSNYNGMPLAAEVIISNGKPQLIRSRQTIDDLMKGEVIPSWDDNSGQRP